MLLTLAPLAGWVAAALGLVLGTKVQPQIVSYLFALVVLPLTFLGAIYYPWKALAGDPLAADRSCWSTRSSTCARASAPRSRPGVPHMSLWAVYGALIGFAVVLTWIGVDGLQRRVVS